MPGSTPSTTRVVNRWSGPSVARAAAAVSTLSTLAVRTGRSAARSNRISPVSALTTDPESSRKRPSRARASIEQERMPCAATSSSGTGRGSGSGVAVGVGVGVGTATGSAEPTATPAKREPVPRTTNATVRAVATRARGCRRPGVASAPSCGHGTPRDAAPEGPRHSPGYRSPICARISSRTPMMATDSSIGSEAGACPAARRSSSQAWNSMPRVLRGCSKRSTMEPSAP